MYIHASVILWSCWLCLLLLGAASATAVPATQLDSLERRVAQSEGRARVDALLDLSLALEYSDLERAIELGLQAESLAEQMNDPAQVYRVKRILGLLHTTRRDLDQALDYLEPSLAYHRGMEKHDRMATLNMDIGNVYMAQDQYSSALEHYLKALRMYERLDNPLGQAQTLNNLGLIYQQSLQPKRSFSCFQRSLKLFRELGHLRGQANVTGNLATYYDDRRQWKKAVEYYLETLDIFRQLDDTYSEGLTLLNLGDCYINAGAYQKALTYLESSRSINETIGDAFNLHFIAGKLGTAHMHLGHLDTAQTLLTGSLAYFLQQDSPKFTAYLQQQLSRLAERQGRYQQALTYYRAYNDAMDTLYQIEKSEAMARMQTRYETEKKEQRIALLEEQRRNQQLILLSLSGFSVLAVIIAVMLFVGYRYQRQTSRRLTEQKAMIETREEEKTLLLRELHHRVKNNLQMVSGLLDLQARKLRDPNAADALKQSRYRIDALSMIHRELYDEDNVARVEMRPYIKELIEHLSEAFEHLSDEPLDIRMEVEELTLDVESAIPLGLILNELITNMFKHAFSKVEAPQLTVNLKRETETQDLLLSVADNGPGLPPDFRLEQSRSFGLRMVGILSRQLKAKIDIRNEAGSRFDIRIQRYKLAQQKEAA